MPPSEYPGPLTKSVAAILASLTAAKLESLLLIAVQVSVPLKPVIAPNSHQAKGFKEDISFGRPLLYIPVVEY